MSVFGGDSWGREAQYRKRRVDDLVVEGLDSSNYKKLSSGKYACLVCPHNPVLDTSLMLSMHIKGSRHRVAESSLKEKQLVIQDEVNKRIAMSECSTGTGESTSTRVNQQSRLAKKPLIAQTRRAASEILHNRTPQHYEAKRNNDSKSNKNHSSDRPLNSNNRGSSPVIAEAAINLVAQQQPDFQERRERELKFTSAGWKRDGHGKWFRDENVEFDSDEDDPNVSLA